MCFGSVSFVLCFDLDCLWVTLTFVCLRVCCALGYAADCCWWFPGRLLIIA